MRRRSFDRLHRQPGVADEIPWCLVAAVITGLIPAGPCRPPPRPSRSSPRARAIRSPARCARAPKRWQRRTASRCFITSRPRPTTSRSRPSLVDEALSAEARRHRVHPGRRQGDGAGRCRRSTRPNIPLVNVGDRLAGGSAVAFVGTDDYGIALDTARTLLKAMGGKGNVMVLEGPDTIPTAAGRLRGFKDALKEFPDVKVVLSKNAMYARPAAARSAQGDAESEPAAADRRRPGRQRRDGVRRGRGVQGGEEETAADRRRSMPARKRSTSSRPATCSPAAITTA